MKIQLLFKSRQETNSWILQRSRPDTVIQNKNTTAVIELTCPFMTNPIKSNLYKQKVYKDLQRELVIPMSHFSILFLEILSLSFVNYKTNKIIKLFNKYNRKLIIMKCQEVAIRTSYFLYCRQNKTWQQPELFFTRNLL